MTRCPLCAPGFIGCQGSTARVSRRPKALAALAVQYFVIGMVDLGVIAKATLAASEQGIHQIMWIMRPSRTASAL